MGDRVHLLRALIAILSAAAGGCIDFVEPELPERGAPAVAEIIVAVSDSGELSVSGAVTPGIASDGIRRTVTDAAIHAATYFMGPVNATESGGRRYGSSRLIDARVMRLNVPIRAPHVTPTSGTPSVEWPGLVRLDGDTVFLREDGQLVLRAREINYFPGEPRSTPETKQWFLTLTGGEGVFRLSSDGAPPDSIVIPRYWLPDAEGRVNARLILQQSGIVRAGDSYVASISLSLLTHWTVLPGPPPS